MKILDPMSDIVFKAIFGKEDKTSKEILITFLNDVLASENFKPIIEITHLNPFNYKDFETDKLSILDIRAKTNQEEIINIEIQVKKEDNYRKRSLYYWAKSYAETISEGETYQSLKKTIMINILNYSEIKESEKLHTIFKIIEQKEHFELVDDLEVHYLELSKLPKRKVGELNGLELWLDFLKEAGKAGNEARLNQLKERSAIMNNLVNKLVEVSADEILREKYNAREKARLDYKSAMAYAENRGIEKGRMEGRMETAKKLLRMGLAPEQIAEAVDLSLEEIEKIIRDMNN